MRTERVKVRWSHRPATALLGRFGGGWQWKLGFQASSLRRPSGTVIVSLLVGDLRIDWCAKSEVESERSR